jgi:quercetin dioxygenase-like cupin family protein
MKVLSSAPPPSRPERPATAVVHNEPNLRVIAFHLLPGQRVPPHHSAGTVLVRVVSGRGVFRGDDGDAVLGPGDRAVYRPGETHAIEAADEALHFEAILAPGPTA